MTKHEAEKWLENKIAFISSVERDSIVLVIDGTVYRLPVMWNQPDLRSIA